MSFDMPRLPDQLEPLFARTCCRRTLFRHRLLIASGRSVQRRQLCEVLAEAVIHDIWRQLKQRPGAEMTIDLPNQILTAPDRTTHTFEISPLRKERLVRGIDDIDVTLEYRDAIERFEAQRRATIPWLPTARRE